MCARVVAGPHTSATDAQRTDDGVEERDDADRAGGQDEGTMLQGSQPRSNADVVARVMEQLGGRHRLIHHTEMRRGCREHGIAPPIARAQREHDAQRHAHEYGDPEKHALRDCLDDFEIAEAPRHLDRADGAVDDQQVSGEPGDGTDEHQSLQHAAEYAGFDERGAAGEGPVPGALCRFYGQPAAADQRDDQQHGADQVQPATPRSSHTVTPCGRSASLRPPRGRRQARFDSSPRSA